MSSGQASPYLLELCCTGQLTWDNGAVEVTFSIRVESGKNPKLEIEPIRASLEASELHRHISDAATLPDVVGLTIEGRSSSNDEVLVSGVWPSKPQLVGCSSEQRLRIRATCCEVRTLHAAEEHEENSRIQYHVPGLSCFSSAQAEFDFANVTVSGVARDGDEPDGLLVVEPSGAREEEAIDSGVSRVLDLVSLANGRRLSWWIRERTVAGRIESVVRTRKPLPPRRWRVFPTVDLQPFLEAGARAYTAEMALETGLAVAIQWVLAYSPHEEVRFLQMMTALEHLLEQRGRAKQFIPTPVFRRLRAELKRKVDECSAAHATDARSKEDYIDLRDALAHINKRPFRKNIQLLLADYRVPLDEIEDWPTLIRLRNSIVHAGLADGTDDEIVSAERVARELLVRVFLAMISFEGHYISWRNGPRSAHFSQVNRPEGDSA